MLEIGAIKLLISHHDKEVINRLEQICDDFTAMVKSGYYSGACEADVKFHETIMKGSRNSRLQRIYENSNIPLFHFKLGTSSQMDDYAQTDEEHRKIVRALKKNDYKTAIDTLKNHLDRGEKEMLGLVPDENTGIQLFI